MGGRSFMLLLVWACLLLYPPVASAKIVHHKFHVGNYTVRPLCKDQVIVAVNERLPGPLIRAREGDTIIVDVFNESPYNMTIHWHGVLQRFSAWADGPSYVTQCPIMPGNKYTYKFNITGQEGTLFWHAHFSILRATVYGGLIIRPKLGRNYPFPKPYKEIPILLGEWWNANVVDVENEALATGQPPIDSDAYTINGRPGRLYSCSRNTFKVKVVKGKTYLLRIINAAVNNQLFFKVAGHNVTVVAIDASYTDPYLTDILVSAPGQTIDVLIKADQAPGIYYMAATPYMSAPITFNNSTTTGIIEYESSTSLYSLNKPLMAVLPAFNDTPTAHHFYTNITSLSTRNIELPIHVDEHMFVTNGLNRQPCPYCVNGSRLAGSMNNISFQLPTTTSILEAHYHKLSGIFRDDFPDKPPLAFDYTNSTAAAAFLVAETGTRVKRLAFGSRVEVVLQNTATVTTENHPMHLHGFSFYVVGQGFGNFDRTRDEPKFNLVNPQVRNTIAVPVGGWAVIRFFADNPGVWQIHCHLDKHLPWGLATAFLVEDGPTPSLRLPPPPSDLPRC